MRRSDQGIFTESVAFVVLLSILPRRTLAILNKQFIQDLIINPIGTHNEERLYAGDLGTGKELIWVLANSLINQFIPPIFQSYSFKVHFNVQKLKMLWLLFVKVLISHLAGMHQDALLWWWSTMQARCQLGFALTTMFTLAYLLRWVQSHQFNICQSNELQHYSSPFLLLLLGRVYRFLRWSSRQ